MSRERAQAVLTSHFGPFGELDFPYVRMGNIDSLHLFGDTELMILAMYVHNWPRWHRALDIGANLGLHSICMARLGIEVSAFEPDPEHYAKLARNVQANGVGAFVDTYQMAVHTRDGEAKFVRVLNNLTGNHLDGFKASYGPRETITVPLIDCRSLWHGNDFAKIDSEGNEAELLLTTTAEDMAHLSAVVEIRNEVNAQAIYDHFNALGVPLWSQRTDWKKVGRFDEMPTANRHGSLYIGWDGPFA